MEEIEKKIRESYIDHILTHKKRPDSMEAFMQNLGEKRTVFYHHYNSFQDLDRQIWKSFFDATLNAIQSSEEYEEFSVYDKVQVYYYGLFNILQPYRDYATFCFEESPFWEIEPSCLSVFTQHFELFAQGIINEGIESGAIASRPFISDYYAKFMWMQTLLVLKTWVSDESEDFDRSDAAVEKTTTFMFDVMGRGLFDSGFDLAKFLLNKS